MNKTVFAILVLLFNNIGIASFLNGNIKKGIMTILSSWITLGIVGIINFVKGILMAIKLFQMSEEEYEAADKTSFEDVIAFFC